MAVSVVSRENGVLTRRLEAVVDDEPVPGLLWTPYEADPAAPLLLAGHGRSAHKGSVWTTAIGERFAARGWNVLAIDAPGHGERRPADATDWPRPDADDSNAGWSAALEIVRRDLGLATDRLAYWGLSMGAALGLALVAGDPRYEAAVFGLMHADWPAPPGTRIRADAAAVSVPVMFLVNWDDTRAPRQSAFELFDRIGSADKRLLAYPGEHGVLPPEAFDLMDGFLVSRLDG